MRPDASPVETNPSLLASALRPPIGKQVAGSHPCNAQRAQGSGYCHVRALLEQPAAGMETWLALLD